MILGITGGTGCGKTTLLNCIAQAGGVILDCDAIYHTLLRTDTVLLDALHNRFPQAFTQGQLDRKALGAIVFADPAALADLNAITHAAVRREVEAALAENPPLAAIDAIALFESGLSDLCSVTVAVTAPTEERVQRLMRRDSISESYARSRILAQHEESWFRERCDFVLHNDGNLFDFQERCLAFLEKNGIIKGRLI